MGVAGAKGNNAKPGQIWLRWAEFGLSLAISARSLSWASLLNISARSLGWAVIVNLPARLGSLGLAWARMGKIQSMYVGSVLVFILTS